MTARLQTAGKVLALFYLAWNMEPPTGMVKTATINLWAKALKDIPLAHIQGLAEEEVRENSFFPKPVDLVRRYNRRHGLTPEGAANVAAYQPYLPSTRLALPASQVPLQIQPEELKRRLGHSSRASIPEEAEEDAPKSNERWSGPLVDVARAGNIDLDACTPNQIADLRTFSRWWLAMHPTLDLRANDFGTAYSDFCQSRLEEENR